MEMALASRNADLNDLVREPREALDVEVKDWLDLTDHDHRALIAKEIIALANHGGGHIVVGFAELADGAFEASKARPAKLDAWSQDAIQSIIAKYVDPGVQCEVVHRASEDSEDRYPIITVPGGYRVPVRAKAGSPDGKKLVANRIYIRRAGPSSEEPRSAEEWDRLLERCLQNRQAELLDAMRSIMSGIVPTSASRSPSRADQLAEFEQQAVARWDRLIASLPVGAPPRFPHGYYDVGFAIDGAFDGGKSLTDLREIVQTVVRTHSGWPPFLTINRPPFTPKPVDGAVECWIGPDADGSFDKPAHHDFWRVAPGGLLFTRRGYSEDGWYKNMEPGKFFDITTPTWRIGEAVLEASYIAAALNATDANLVCHCRWTGLAARALISYGNPNRGMFSGVYTSAQDSYETTKSIAVSALPGALPEFVMGLLAPLYELFSFFRLPKRLVEEELQLMRKA